MNAYPPRRWAHMRRAWAAWSLDRLEACSITQTLAPARSTKSEPRDALGGDVDRRRPGDGTIDDVALTDADGLEEDRDRGRGRYRATDVDVRELARTEDEALRRIDVHSGHIKRARERGEVMRVSERRESGAERALEGLGRVEAGRVMGLEVRQHRRERRPGPSADGAADHAEERPGELCEELDHVSGGGAEDVLGPEVEGRVEVVAQGPEQ